ncbi:MAG: PmoA family protein [Tannerella sp.]|jgi:hypothetical protein|nr:PmoA family protein [Tannerella sp.]
MKYTLLLFIICAVGVNAQPQTVSAVKIGDRIDVTIGNKFFTSYHFDADEKYPFFFPVNGPLTGSGVTSMRNGEYPHHSSIFFGCDKVNGGNYWQEGLERGRIISEGATIVEAKGSRVVIKDACLWKRPDAEAPFKDKRTITISAPSANLWQIDFDVEIETLTDVTIQKTNHSLFSIRLDPDLSVKEGGVMVNAEGEQGEKATFGTTSAWIDCYGTRKAGVEGIAMLQHPSNIVYPAQWFTRDYGFVSPTPLYWPENGSDTFIPSGYRVAFRYRVLIHAGDTKQADIAGQFLKYRQE